ncbi:MAG: copper amine oxidase N-terminal domain-containing protein, partial [Oscillospiraceae bacterium]
MKRLLASLLSLCLLISLCPLAVAAPNGMAAVQVYSYTKTAYEPTCDLEQISVVLGDAPLQGDMPAVNLGGRTMIPIRAIAEALGAQVEWVPEYNQAVLRQQSSTIVLTLGSAEALVNGLPVQLPDGVPAGIMRTPDGGERTMVPLRFVSEQLGVTVDWVAATATAVITAPLPPSPEPEV